MTFKELQRIVKFAKKSGIVKLKLDGVELEFTHEALMTRPRKATFDTQNELKPIYTPEQELMWSAGGSPEVING